MVAGYEPSEAMAKCLISGRKAPPPVLRTILRIDVVNVCVTAKVVRKNVSQHPCGARYGSRVRAERSEGEVPGFYYISPVAVWQTGKVLSQHPQPNDHLGRLFRTINSFLNFINTLSVYAKAYSIAEFNKI